MMHANAFDPTRAYRKTIRKGATVPYAINLTTLIPASGSISTVKWTTQCSNVSTADAAIDGNNVTINLTGKDCGEDVVQCTATLSDGSVYPLVTVVHILPEVD